MKRAILFFTAASILLLPTFFSAQAIEYGMLGGRPANPDPKIENSASWFIYSVPAGEAKEDALEVMNLFDQELEVLVYAADTVKSSAGGFALKQFSEINEGVGSWVKFYPDSVPEKFNGFFEKKGKSILETCKASDDEIALELKEKVITEEFFSPLRDWCAGKDSVEKKFFAKERLTVPFILSVPSGIDVGEHTGGILIQKKSQDDAPSSGGSSVKLTTRVGVRIYQTVPGEIIRKINLEHFKIVANFSEFDFSDWFGKAKKPKEYLLETKVTNQGNVSISHQNDLYIKDILFGKRDEEIRREFQVLKGDKFIANYSWKKPLFGYYSFQPEIRYQNGEIQEMIKGDIYKMWVIPWRELTIMFVLSALLATGVYFWKKRQKKLYGGIGWVTYEVKKNDTVATLSVKFNTDWMILVKTNKLKAPYILEVGQTLLVPSSEEANWSENFFKNNAKVDSETADGEISESNPENEKKEVSMDIGTAEIKSETKKETAASGYAKTEKIQLKEKKEDNESTLKIFEKPPKIKEIDYKEGSFSWVKFAAVAVGISVILAIGTFFLIKAKNNSSSVEKASISDIAQSTAVEDSLIPVSPIEQKGEAKSEEALAHPKEDLLVKIFNGSGVAGSAGKLQGLLIEKGYVKTEALNAKDDSYQGVSVYNDKGFEKDAQELVEILKKLGYDAEVQDKSKMKIDPIEDIGNLGVFLGK